jgi:hypothetical protein
MNRKDFLKTGAIAAAGFTILPSGTLFAKSGTKVRLGFIGVGARGMSHISEAILRDDTEIIAICDIQERSLNICRTEIAKSGRPAAKEYTGGLDAYKRLLERNDIDAVIIATPWQYHHIHSFSYSSLSFKSLVHSSSIINAIFIKASSLKCIPIPCIASSNFLYCTASIILHHPPILLFGEYCMNILHFLIHLRNLFQNHFLVF